MNIKTLAKLAFKAIDNDEPLIVIVPRPWKGRPKNFPKGKLLGENDNGNVYQFPPDKILNWINKNLPPSKT